MASTRDLAIASISAAAGAVAAAAALLYSYTATNSKPQSPPPPCTEPLPVNGCAARHPPAQDPFKTTKREGLVPFAGPPFTTLAASRIVKLGRICAPLFFGSCCRFISWDDYFMAIAFLSAERSKDPNRQVKYISVDDRQNILNMCLRSICS